MNERIILLFVGNRNILWDLTWQF